MEPRRCATHGLVASEDGRCVICKRGETPNEKATSSDLPVVILVGVVGVAAVGVLGYGLTKRIRGLVEQGPPPIAVEAPAAPKLAASVPPTLNTSNSRRDFPTFLETTASAAQPEEAEPDDARLEAEKKRIPITMYARNDCRLCDNARIWVTQRGYQLKELDISRSATDMVLLESVNPQKTVPTFDIGGKVLIGYDRQVIDDVLSEQAAKRLPKK